MKQRIQITLDPKVYALIKNTQANKSKYIEDLIIRDFEETHREKIIERMKESILEDVEFQQTLKAALKGEKVEDDINYTQDWGA